MAIVINGSGTVTGLSVGGLPDGTVDADTLASGAGGVDGVSSSADATAIKIDSSERVAIGNTDAGNYYSSADNLVVYDATDHVGITIASGGSDKINSIYFADGTSGTAEYEGSIEYHHSTNTMLIGTNHATAMTIDSIGAVTMSKQPAFLRTELTGDQSITSTSPVTVTFDTEKYDQNSDMTSTTFTAPVTGKYLFAMAITAESLNDDYIVMHLDTSNHNYAIHPLSTANNSATYKAMTGSLIVDMDANDTAIITANSANDSSYTLRASRTFCGALIC